MSKQFWAVVAVIVIVLVGIFAITNHKSNTGTNTSSSNKPSQHIEGQGKTGVTLVEYGDYECPYCGAYYPVVKQIQSEYNTQIYFQFRNFPLVSIHQNAFAGARAAEAASLMGKFWEMHDLLYENQNQWSSASDPTTFFNQYAQQLGLDANTFKQDYGSDQVNNVINADMAVGNQLGINATPTFYLDGKQIQVAIQASSFETLINSEIAKKAGLAPANTNTTSAGTTAQTKK
jgi:protein-disulfide isomerase